VLVFNSDSEEQFTLNDSDIEPTHKMPEDSADSIQRNKAWNNRTNENWATIH
jgi:hypothetical protein